jgi:CheY-like chemotaxis protein
MLKGQSGFLNILSATNGKQALELLRKEQIHIVITAIRLREIDGFELMARLSREFPSIKVIVMTSDAHPLLKARIKRFPSAVHIDQAHDMCMLTRRVFTELQIDYGGQVRGINLSSFLQMLELENRSGTLRVATKDQIISWKNVSIDIDYTMPQTEQEIALPLMMLILESGQMEDEKRSGTANKRAHERYELLVALDYDLRDMSRHCLLRDISLEGAYIETDHEIETGQVITLTLTAPALKISCSVDATVVRRDSMGIGVRFQTLNSRHRRMIQAIIGDSLMPNYRQENADDHPTRPM